MGSDVLIQRSSVGNGQSPSNSGPMFNLDPMAAAKQMAALSSAGRARRATHGPVDDKSQSPTIPFASLSSYMTPGLPANPMNHPPQTASSVSQLTTNPQQQQQQQPQQQPQHAQTPQNQAQQQLMHQLRNRQGFLQGLATFLSHRGTPLPATITGMQAPNWNPENTPWKPLEPGTEIGTFKLAGKNIDIHRLFNMVFQVGGSTKVRI